MAFFDISSSGTDLQTLIGQQARALQGAQRAVGRDIAKIGKKAILDDVKSRRGSLSMMGGRLSVKAKTAAGPGGADVTLSASPAGPWTIVDSGADAHEIRPRKGALRFDGRFAARVHHPGTRGTRVWSNAETALDRALTPTIEDTFDEAMDV